MEVCGGCGDGGGWGGPEEERILPRHGVALAIGFASVALACGDGGAGPSPGANTIPLAAEVAVPQNYGLHDTFVRDGIAFLCAWNTGVRIYDVGNGAWGGSPTAPRHISTIVTADAGLGGARAHNAWWFHNPSGDKTYLFVGQEGPAKIGSTSSGDIHVVDVSDLENPVEVASYHLDGAGTHNFWMDESAQVLFAAYYNGGVVALDVSGTLAGDLAAREIDRIEPGGAGDTFVWGVMQAAGSVYAADMLSGFWQLSFDGAAFAVAGGGFNVPEHIVSDLWVHGDYAYTGTWGGSNIVNIWHLSATGAPTLVDSLVVPNVLTISDVQVSDDGTQLVISTEGGSNAGVHVYGLANPDRPAPLGRYLVTQGVHTATVAEIGGRRYVFAARNPGDPALLILDITDVGG